jgi:HicB family
MNKRRRRSRSAVKSARRALEETRSRPGAQVVQSNGGLYTRDMVRGPSLADEPAASGDGDEAEPSPEAGAKHSGKLLVRMPATLHDELARVAQTEGVSLNQLITGVLASSVGWRGEGVKPVTLRAAAPDTEGAEPPISPRLTRAALVANLTVVLLAAIAAIVLLVAAWQAGF